MVLPYCMIDVRTAQSLRTSHPGVRGAAVEALDESGLRCFYSELPHLAPKGAAATREDALAFYRVTREIFDACTVIPFRFPTLLPDTAALQTFLRNNSSLYAAALDSLHGMVQMEARLTPAATSGARDRTGKEYLRGRQAAIESLETAAQALGQAAGAWASDSRQRTSAHGRRCFWLVRRSDVGRFEQELRCATLPPAVTISLSGPWPPTEFIPSSGDPVIGSSASRPEGFRSPDDPITG